MTKLHESLETSLDREAAFAYIADWSRQAEWDPNTVSAARIGDGGPEVGARYALEVKGLPRIDAHGVPHHRARCAGATGTRR